MPVKSHHARHLCTLFICTLLTACSTSGVLHGRWQAAPKADKHKHHHRQSRDILIDYIQNASATSGILRVVVPNGEIFKGKFLQITTTSTSESMGMTWGMWDPYWGDWGPFDDPWYGGGGFTTFRKNYSGKVVATLMGNRGGTMRCRIHLAEPGEGLDGGGVGQCQDHHGDHIDLSF